MRLFIEPSDVWLFRTSHNFTAGESGLALSVFPPTPETVQGAIRARLAASWNPVLSRAFANPRLVELIGSRESCGRFRLAGLTLGRRKDGRVQQLFPPPAHLLRSEEPDAAGRYRLYRLMPQMHNDPTLRTNWPDDPPGMRLLQSDRQPEQDDEKLVDFDQWLTGAGLHAALGEDTAFRALQDAKPGALAVRQACLFEREERLGIGMNNRSKTTEEGLLYQVSFIRLKRDVGLVADVAFDGLNTDHVMKEEFRFPERGWLALGGEHRAASFEVLKPDTWDEPLRPSTGQRSCLYLMTPAYFTGGWQPGNWQTMVGANPVAAAIPRAQLIGGWRQRPENAGGDPKPLRRCVPAGSVYFFDGPVKSTRPFTDESSEIGYGIVYEGAW